MPTPQGFFSRVLPRGDPQSGFTHIADSIRQVISYVWKRGYFISLVSLVVELWFDDRRRSLFSNVCAEFAAAFSPPQVWNKPCLSLVRS